MAFNYAEYVQRENHFSYFLEQFGQPTKHREVEIDILEKYRNILPNQLLTYWQTYGFCSFKDGLFWIVNPSDYEHIVQAWLPKAILDKEKPYVIARNGWGKLYLWSPSLGSRYDIDVRNNWIFERKYDFITELVENGYEDKALEDFFGYKTLDSVDLRDLKETSNDQYLFAPSVEKFGRLKENEIFVFIPPMFLDGERKLENVKKVDLFIHFDIQRQVYEPELMNREGLFKKGWG